MARRFQGQMLLACLAYTDLLLVFGMSYREVKESYDDTYEASKVKLLCDRPLLIYNILATLDRVNLGYCVRCSISVCNLTHLGGKFCPAS
jgi:hypothetical protein